MVTQNAATTQVKFMLDIGNTASGVLPPVVEIVEPEDEIAAFPETKIRDTDVTEAVVPSVETTGTAVTEDGELRLQAPAVDILRRILRNPPASMIRLSWPRLYPS